MSTIASRKLQQDYGYDGYDDYSQSNLSHEEAIDYEQAASEGHSTGD